MAILKAKNNTGSTIPAGSVVYVSGFDSASGVSLISLASCDNSAKMPAVGLVTSDVSNGQQTSVKTEGKVAGFDTSFVDVNTQVYLGLNGAITFNDPYFVRNTYTTQLLGVVISSASPPYGQITIIPFEIEDHGVPKVIPSTPNNFVAFNDAVGNQKDSGYSAGSFATETYVIDYVATHGGGGGGGGGSTDGYAYLTSHLNEFTGTIKVDGGIINTPLKAALDGYISLSSLGGLGSQPVSTSGTITGGQIIDSGLTSGYIVSTTTSGQLQNSNWTVAALNNALDGYLVNSGTETITTSGTITGGQIIDSGLTPGYIVSTTTSGQLQNSNWTVGALNTALDGYVTAAQMDAYVAAVKLVQLEDADHVTVPAKNSVVMWNGTKWTYVPYTTSFVFSIASFTCTAGNNGIVLPMPSGTSWVNSGVIYFSAAYNNGPCTSASVSGSTSLAMTGVGYTGPTSNTSSIALPSVGGYLYFTLTATDGVVTPVPASTIYYYFYNYIYYGVSTKSSGYASADITGLAGQSLNNSANGASVWTVNPSLGQYILFACPMRLGGPSTFTVGGFSGGFSYSQSNVSVTNSSGYTESYYVYRSDNSGLGLTQVFVS